MGSPKVQGEEIFYIILSLKYHFVHFESSFNRSQECIFDWQLLIWLFVLTYSISFMLNALYLLGFAGATLHYKVIHPRFRTSSIIFRWCQMWHIFLIWDFKGRDKSINYPLKLFPKITFSWTVNKKRITFPESPRKLWMVYWHQGLGEVFLISMFRYNHFWNAQRHFNYRRWDEN